METYFRNEDLHNLANLYEYANNSGLVETGSSSINNSFTKSVEAVKKMMREKTGVRPSNQMTAALWAGMGDTDATFYFSGYRTIEGKSERVGTALYLHLLSDVVPYLERADILMLDALAKNFIGVFREIKAGTLTVVDLDD